jgi:hypothetical protein
VDLLFSPLQISQLESVELLSTVETVELHRCRMFQNLAILVTPDINLVVAFAKQVPGSFILRRYMMVSFHVLCVWCRLSRAVAR